MGFVFLLRTVSRISAANTTKDVFETFWTEEKNKAFEQICKEEGLVGGEIQKLINDYLYSGRTPRREDFAKTLQIHPGILQRDSIIKRLSEKFNKFITTFIEGV